jgi:hypothetical protein
LFANQQQDLPKMPIHSFFKSSLGLIGCLSQSLVLAYVQPTIRSMNGQGLLLIEGLAWLGLAWFSE